MRVPHSLKRLHTKASVVKIAPKAHIKPKTRADRSCEQRSTNSGIECVRCEGTIPGTKRHE